MAQLSQADINTGVEQLSHALENQAAAGLDFCEIWPDFKKLLGIIDKFVPVIGKLVISGLEAVGDGVYKKKCGKKK